MEDNKSKEPSIKNLFYCFFSFSPPAPLLSPFKINTVIKETHISCDFCQNMGSMCIYDVQNENIKVFPFQSLMAVSKIIFQGLLWLWHIIKYLTSHILYRQRSSLVGIDKLFGSFIKAQKPKSEYGRERARKWTFSEHKIRYILVYVLYGIMKFIGFGCQVLFG